MTFDKTVLDIGDGDWTWENCHVKKGQRFPCLFLAKTWRQNDDDNTWKANLLYRKKRVNLFSHGQKPKFNYLMKISPVNSNFQSVRVETEGEKWCHESAKSRVSNAHLPTRKILIFLLIKSDVTEALLKMLFFELTDYTSPLDYSILFFIKAIFKTQRISSLRNDELSKPTLTSLNFTPSLFSIQKSRKVKPLNFPNF